MKKISFVMGIALLCTLTISNAQVVADATIKGSPYLKDAYEDGTILLSTKKFTYPARYNAYNDLIEYQQNGKTLVLDPSVAVKKINLNNTTFLVEKYQLDGKPKFGYFALLDSGKVMLFSKKVINYLPAKKGGALDGSDQPAQFNKDRDKFYFKVAGGTLEEVKNIKSMIAAFPDKHDELTVFAKKEKISPKDEEELTKLVKYYNALQ
jgi:hypothetical protein